MQMDCGARQQQQLLSITYGPLTLVCQDVVSVVTDCWPCELPQHQQQQQVNSACHHALLEFAPQDIICSYLCGSWHFPPNSGQLQGGV